MAENSFLIGQGYQEDDDKSEFGLTPTPTQNVTYVESDNNSMANLDYDIPENDFQEVQNESVGSEQPQVISLQSEAGL